MNDVTNIKKDIDVNELRKEAEVELQEERVKDAKRRIKSKLTELQRAEKVVANIKRELEDLYDEIRQGN